MAPAPQASTEEAIFDTGEQFADLLEESLGDGDSFEGTVVKGTVVAVDGDAATIDVGLKSEGRVDLKEFSVPGQVTDIKVGDIIDIFVERFEDRDGIVRLSREKARREESWAELETSFNATERVNGVIFGRVKCGFIVILTELLRSYPDHRLIFAPYAIFPH